MKCPRCKTGFVSHEQDRWGAYQSCVSCGWVNEKLVGEITPMREGTGGPIPIRLARRKDGLKL